MPKKLLKANKHDPHIDCCMVGIFNYFVDARVRAYAKWLINNGDHVDVLTMYRYESRKMIVEDGVRIFPIPSRQEKGNRLVYLLGYIFSFIVLDFQLTKLYLQNHYDVIHFHNMPDFLVFTGIIPKLFGAKLILDIHDPMPEMFESKFPDQRESLGMKMVRLEEKLSTAFADEIITANPHFKRNLTSRGVQDSRITVIDNFPDLEYFCPTMRASRTDEKHNHFMLIFPGTIAPRYGLDVAIKSLPFLREKIPSIHLLLVGRLYEYSNVLRSLADQLGVSDLVEFRPGVPNKEVPLLLVQSDVGIYPALPDSHMSIAVPGKLLEFAIMGLPIVSSRLQIVEEIFTEDSVLYFDPGDVSQFTQCILKLYYDKSLRQHLAAHAGHELAEKYSQEKEKEAYMLLLNHLLA